MFALLGLTVSTDGLGITFVGGGGGVVPEVPTPRVKVSVLMSEPAVPVTVTVVVPTAAEALAMSVSVEEQVGLHEGTLHDAVTPLGRFEAEKLTGCAVPEESV